MPPSPADGPLGRDGKKLIRRLASSFAGCSDDARAYGACVKAHLEGVSHRACEKEFQALALCFRKQLASARARGQ
jgi:hypothetical protein